MKKYFKYTLLLFIVFGACSTNKVAKSKNVSTQDTTNNVVLETEPKGTFNWYLGLCNYEGVYDTTKYTREEIQNLFELSMMGILLQTSSTVADYEEAHTLRVEELDKEYNEKVSYFTSLKLPSDYTHFKIKKLDKLQLEYNFKRKAIEAYTNFKVLENSPPNCQKYADAIIAQNETTIQACREMIEERVKSGSYSQSSLTTFESKVKSDHALKYATTQLLTYGWWNCVNEIIQDEDIDHDTIYPQFKSLFKDITEECDEP